MLKDTASLAFQQVFSCKVSLRRLASDTLSSALPETLIEIYFCHHFLSWFGRSAMACSTHQ